MSDDITTIFVVGFPDDMREREFQNMFTFSPGFEAATLKIPNDDDKDAQKKQIIGFAKFHSRVEALEARDVLTGRKVDAEKNCVLKAEMAKKNLHTKRGLSSMGLSTAMAATFGLDTPTTALGFPPQGLSSQAPSQQHTPGVPRTASLSNTMLASGNRPEHLRISAARTFNPFNDIPLASAPILGAGSGHRGFGSAQYSSAFSSNADAASVAATAAMPQPGTAGVMGGFMYSEALPPAIGAAPTHSSMLLNRRGSMHSSTPVSSSLAMSASNLAAMHPVSAQQQPTSEPSSSDGDALHMASQGQQSAAPAQPALQQPALQPQPKGLAGQRPAVLDIAALQPRLSQLGLGQLSATSLMSPMGVPYSASLSTPTGMVLPMATTRSVNSNDQNPPCNTLYVGNLPVGANEDELRQLFQTSLGYKRMSYKAKPNSGPMCFVEFESIDFATLAMSDLDGRMLSNSVGGGIRLSYSKNPLGVRSQNNPHNNPHNQSSAMLSSAAVAAAAAAMAGGYHAANGSPYGYPMSALQQQQHQPPTPHAKTQGPPPAHGISPIHQGATPSPPGQTPTTRSAGVAGNHQHSLSSSSRVSPIPSPGAKGPGDQGAMPRDALSFLHQPIHQLHKQASDPTGGSTTPPQSATNGTVSHASNIALEQ
ncbi:hypothetical protein H4S02_002229 [Coemansia sp. RSA 2611]|nr:hypothetical protein IWW54_002183 [Coemansia sp. RSA 2705]KAJ2389717.1 hypothetical protein H4S02_002229 [Coemansia sp. RSA 2611]